MYRHYKYSRKYDATCFLQTLQYDPLFFNILPIIIFTSSNEEPHGNTNTRPEI